MSSAVIQKLKELGYTTIPEEFYSRVDLWESWYQGNVKNFHRYRKYNGHEWVNCERETLGMAKKVCEDWANLLLNEKIQITVDGKAEQDFINRILKENNFSVKANEMQELKAALGTVAYIPRVVGQRVNDYGALMAGTADDIFIDYVTMEHIYPISWQNGIITECAFDNIVNRGGKRYLFLQIFRKAKTGNYIIENSIYGYENEVLTPANLSDVSGFEHIPDYVDTGSSERQFVIDRLAIANNVDYLLPVGIPVFANSISVLRVIDKAYDCYANEFDNGALLLAVKMPATRYEDGRPTFDKHDNRIYLLPEDTQQGNVVDAISPQLRTSELNIGLQDQLNVLSSKCGFGTNFYQFNQGAVMATATQVISTNSKLAESRGKHQLILRDALTELCRILLRLGNKAIDVNLNENAEISITFDDSIFIDTESERAQDRLDVNMGAMSLLEYRMKWYGEDEATAKAALPKMQDMTTEEQQEVE